MKIGTLGTGRMATGLGRLWATGGHQLYFGSREPDKARALAVSVGNSARGGSYRDAVEWGDVVLLATPWGATEATLQGVRDLASGKIFIDCVNPVAPGGDGLAFGHTNSFAEQVAAWSPGARVVKAFNHIFWENLARPDFDGQQASTFLCGDHGAAKTAVATLAQEIGYEAVDAGPLRNARLLEPLALLWIQLAFHAGQGPNTGFKLLRR